MKGTKLKNTEGFMRKSDPFFELHRKIDAAGAKTWDNVYRSNVVKDNLSPEWDEVQIEMSVLCGGDKDLPILVKVFDYESSGKHVPMGQFETTVSALESLADTNSLIKLKKSGKDTGTINITKFDIAGVGAGAGAAIEDRVAGMSVSPSPPPSGPVDFADYIGGGTEINVSVAIDFTGSNGDPRKPGTLHYMHKDGNLNDYESVIKSIVGVLQKYDSDKKYPVFGFGAKYSGVINHCFKCGDSEECDGIDGILTAYRGIFKSGLVMSGPTDFNQVIKTAAARAESSLEAALGKNQQTYSVLLIVTDGSVSDVASTVKCLQQVGDAPLSIVIVGVGSADFTGMRFLDDQRGQRDIVQFVPFNKHRKDPVDLSSATLSEIPEQLVAYFQKHDIQPGAAVRAKEEEIYVGEEEEIDLTFDFGDEEIVVAGGGDDFNNW